MKLLPKSIAELDPNLQWSIEIHLRILEEVVLSTEPSEPRGLSKAEAERPHGPCRGSAGLEG